MKCPSCFTAARLELEDGGVWKATDYVATRRAFHLEYGDCPECGHLLVFVSVGKYDNTNGYESVKDVIEQRTVFPAFANRPLDETIPSDLRQEFAEAASVLSFSPRASAALSRRVLQRVLQEHFNIKRRTLDLQIEDFLALPNLPTYVSDAVDAIRQIGNLAAHPAKYQHSGEIVEVEPGEAEWLLDVLESLFDFAYVQPGRLLAKRDALNGKLARVGKPQLKKTR